LARALALSLGLELPEPMPRAMEDTPTPEVETAPSLSLRELPGEPTIASRKIAVIVAEGMVGEPIAQAIEALSAAGAMVRVLSSRLGAVRSADGNAFEIDATLENTPAVLFDALILPDGADAVEALSKDGRTLEFLKDQYRHCKTVLILGASSKLLQKAGIFEVLPTGLPDPGLIVAPASEPLDALEKFKTGVARHRHPERDTDPPLV
jgi:catalase